MGTGLAVTDVIIRSESPVSLLSSCFPMTLKLPSISSPFHKEAHCGVELIIQGLM